MAFRPILFICTAFPRYSFLAWGTPEEYVFYPLPSHPDDPKGILLFQVLDRIIRCLPQLSQEEARLAVCIGPGAMTGLKYGIASALGLALALKRNLVGVSSFFGWASLEEMDSCVEIPVGSSGGFRARLIRQGRSWELRDPEWISTCTIPESPPYPRSFLKAAAELPEKPLSEIKPLYIRPPQIYPQSDFLGRPLESLYPSQQG